MKRKVVSVALALVLLSSNVAMAAPSITGIKSYNNQERELDYKISEERYQEIIDSLNVAGSEKEVFPISSERSMSGLTVPLKPEEESGSKDIFDDSNFKKLTSNLTDKELAWLVENNIVSREGIIKIGDTVDIDPGPALFDRNEPNVSMRKSDFLMGVYKSLYGVKESRPLVFNRDAWRVAQKIRYEEVTIPATKDEPERTEIVKIYEPEQKQIVNTGEEYLYKPADKDKKLEREFPEGDWFVYVSPNVYELYFKEMLDKKILTIEEFKDLEFIESYQKIGTSLGQETKSFPLWWNELAPYKMTAQGTSQPNNLVGFDKSSQVFGRSFSVSGAGRGATESGDGKSSLIQKREPNYFLKESMDSITALRYVESMLRLTEKDMTDTEARIVTYKYGSSYLNSLADEDRKTVMFLTAKGILNFEDRTEYRNLYGNLTKEFGYKLLYRLANKNARVNFSEIQLTDSDNFWLDKGYTQVNLNFNLQDPLKKDELRNEDGEYDVLPVPSVDTAEVVEIESSPSAQIETKRVFGVQVNRKVSSFAAPAEDGTKKYKVVKVFDDKRKYKYKGTRLDDKNLKGKFPEITNAKTAVKGNKNQLELTFQVNAANATVALATVDSNIQTATDQLYTTKGINAVTKYAENGNEMVLVPAAAFKDVNSEIVVLEDKLLKNKKTGTMAVLLDDNNIAIVGTHVIHSEDLMIKAINGEKYYNLDIIKSLMSNAYISKLDSRSIYISDSIYSEKLVSVLGTTGNEVSKTYVARFKTGDSGGDAGASATVSNKDFLNISQLTSNSNFIIRDFQMKNDKNEIVNFKVILHLIYKLPDKNANFTDPVYDSKNPSLSAVNKFMYTRPADKQLADWWDNNIELSNAFANVMYETKGVKYVKSGYLVPNVTILYDNNDKVQNQQINDMLTKVGTELSAGWAERFMGDTTGFNKPMEGKGNLADKSNPGGKYYPEKNIPAGQFPKWVHAMFNNDNGRPANGPALPTIGQPTKFANTELWRYLMADRTLTYQSSKELSKGNSVFETSSGTYVVTNSDMVYKLIEEDDPKFPVQYNGTSVKLKTRTEEDSKDYWDKSYVTVQGYEFYVANISGTTATLIDKLPIVGTPVVSTKNNKTFYDINGSIKYPDRTGSPMKNAIEGRYVQLRNQIFAPSGNSGYSKAMPSFDSAGRVTGQLPQNEMGSGLYFVDSNPAKGYSQNDKPFKEFTNAGTKSVSYKDVGSKKVTAHLMFNLDLNYWSIDNGKLVMRKSSPYLQTGNIYYSGLNQGVIDSLIMNSVGTVRPSKLQDGSTLIIGDMRFVKHGDNFVSMPQTNLESWQKVIKNATDPNIVGSTISKQFTGYLVKVGNTDIPLAAFVKNRRLGLPPTTMKLDATLVGNESSKQRANVSSTTEDGSVSTKVYNTKKLPTIKSVVFQIGLDNNLLVRKIDDETKTYQLLLSTNTLSEGFLEDSPFFEESLSLSEKDDLFLLMDKSDYSPLASSDDIKKNFLDLYEKAFRGDVISLLKVIVITALSYLILVSWACYMIVTFKVGYGILSIIREPVRGSSRTGIDVIKIISFGIADMDTPIPVTRVIFSNLLMFGMIYILFDVL